MGLSQSISNVWIAAVVSNWNNFWTPSPVSPNDEEWLCWLALTRACKKAQYAFLLPYAVNDCVLGSILPWPARIVLASIICRYSALSETFPLY